MSETKDIRQEQGGALAVYDYGQDAGAGYENQTAADVQIPFITILQDLSPQVKKRDPLYIAGAEPGMLLNTVTGEILPEGVEFIPSTTEQCFVEWRSRDAGGGFVARHDLDSAIVQKARAEQTFGARYTSPDGNDLIDTFYMYGLLVIGDRFEPAVIAFSSTKIKVYRKWNTKTRAFQIAGPEGRKITPPLFAHRVTIGAATEKNAKGEFWNFTLKPAAGSVAESLLAPDDVRYQAAKKLKEMIGAGMAKAAYESQGDSTEGDADVPF